MGNQDRQDDETRFWKAGPMAHVQSLLRQAGRGLTDLILPLDTPTPPASPVTTVARARLDAPDWSRIRFIEAPVCDGCGTPFEADQGVFAATRCAACLARPAGFGRARAACVYDAASRPLLLRFKHADDQTFAPLFARWLSRAAHDLIQDADAVVPVPLHRLRLLGRRFNQAAEIARPLARMTALDYLPDALVRSRATPSQGGLGASGRKRNVRGVFHVPANRRARLKGRHLLLIDDVLTTGATASACARVLLDAGARAVDLAVVARVDGPR